MTKFTSHIDRETRLLMLSPVGHDVDPDKKPHIEGVKELKEGEKTEEAIHRIEKIAKDPLAEERLKKITEEEAVKKEAQAMLKEMQELLHDISPQYNLYPLAVIAAVSIVAIRKILRDRLFMEPEDAHTPTDKPVTPATKTMEKKTGTTEKKTLPEAKKDEKKGVPEAKKEPKKPAKAPESPKTPEVKKAEEKKDTPTPLAINITEIFPEDNGVLAAFAQATGSRTGALHVRLAGRRIDQLSIVMPPGARWNPTQSVTLQRFFREFIEDNRDQDVTPQMLEELREEIALPLIQAIGNRLNNEEEKPVDMEKKMPEVSLKEFEDRITRYNQNREEVFRIQGSSSRRERAGGPIVVYGLMFRLSGSEIDNKRLLDLLSACQKATPGSQIETRGAEKWLRDVDPEHLEPLFKILERAPGRTDDKKGTPDEIKEGKKEPDKKEAKNAPPANKPEKKVDTTKIDKMSPEEFLKSLPQQLPGAGRIDRMIVPGARHILIHIRQYHLTGDGGGTDVEKAIQISGASDEIRTSQTQIYGILGRLSSIYGSLSLYQEGCNTNYGEEGMAQDFQKESQALQLKKQLLGLRNSAEDLIAFGGKDPQAQKLLTDIEKRLKNARTDLKSAKGTTDMRYLASAYLVRDGRARLLPAEKPETLQRGIDHIKKVGEFEKETTKKLHDIRVNRPRELPQELVKFLEQRKKLEKEGEQSIFDDREDALLDIIHQSGMGVGIAIYGAAHNWQDNIERWNKQNPNEMFSLITISPQATVNVPQHNAKRLERDSPPGKKN